MNAIVLLSAGLDSLVNTAIALSQGWQLEALTFDYGQRASRREQEYAARICQHYNIRHQVVALPWLAEITSTALVSSAQDIPDYDQDKLDDKAYAGQTARAVWVPNRNGVFINIAASFAEARGIEKILVGFNREEAVTFPDNSVDYLERVNQSLTYSTLSQVQVSCFTLNNDKKEIAAIARQLEVPLDLAWPCYYGGETLCGQCESCRRFARAKES